jgi:hypothetical protein
VKSVIYCRANPVKPLLPTQLEDFRRALVPVETEVLDDATGMGFRQALAKAKEVGGQLAVFRIEHLARTGHRAARLRRLVEEGVPLFVMEPWALKDVPLLQVADYTEMLLTAREIERGINTRLGIEMARASGREPGRPRLCTCNHPPTKGGEPVHEEGTGRCLIEGCPCIEYQPRATEVMT